MSMVAAHQVDLIAPVLFNTFMLNAALIFPALLISAETGFKISKHELQPGDLVFFAGDFINISHVGIYVGNGQMIHASTTYGIAYDSLSRDYRVAHYAGARRII